MKQKKENTFLAGSYKFSCLFFLSTVNFFQKKKQSAWGSVLLLAI